MSILDIRNLSHIYDDKVLFDDSSVSINNKEHIGIIGLNGAGKTTFINILAGKTMQDRGEVLWGNRIRRGYLDQHADIDRSLTVEEYLHHSFDYLYELNTKMEEIYSDMGNIEDPDELEKMINRANNILEKLTHEGFFDLDSTIKKVANNLGIGQIGYDKVIGTLSGGQRAKVMLSRLLLENLDVMLLDEPTNFLDIEHIEWLANYLNDFEGTFMVISHDTDFLNKICKYIVAIENGQIKKYGGNYDKYLLLHEQNSKQYEDQYNRQQQQIAQMKDYIAKNSARAATAGMANSRKKMLEKIDVMAPPKTILDAEISFPYEFLNSRIAVEAKKLEIGYNGNALLPPIDFEMGSQTKLWIRGTNGIGKSTLLKTIMGKIPPVSGSFFIHPSAKIGYLEQELDWDNPNINSISFFAENYPRMNQKQHRTAVAKLGLKNDLALRPINKMSGGEQVRLRIAVLNNKVTNILVLDEPTNHLDVRAKEVLKQALIDYQGAIILVSHEAEFAEDVCDKIFDVKF